MNTASIHQSGKPIMTSGVELQWIVSRLASFQRIICVNLSRQGVEQM